MMCPNNEVVVFQPRTVTAPDLGSVSSINNFLALLPHLFQPYSIFLFFPPPEPISYHFPIFQPLMLLLSLFAPISIPPSCLVVERLSTWTAPPHSGRHGSSTFPSHAGRPKEFLVQTCDCLPSSSCLFFLALDLLTGPFQLQGLSRPRVPDSLCLPPPSIRPISPLTVPSC